MHLLDETSRKNILIGHSSGRRAGLYFTCWPGVTGLRPERITAADLGQHPPRLGPATVL